MDAITASSTCAVQMLDVAFSRRMCCSRVWSASRVAGLPRLSMETPTSRPGMERLYRSEEHTSELQSLMRISYAVFCLKKKNKTRANKHTSATYKRKRCTSATISLTTKNKKSSKSKEK